MISRRIVLWLLAVAFAAVGVVAGARIDTTGANPMSGVASLSAGEHSACILTTAGGAKCWGANYYGEVGDGTDTLRKTPVDVVGLTSGVASVSVGWDHACAVTDDGVVKCWGKNGAGQLGAATSEECVGFPGLLPCSHVPVDVQGISPNSAVEVSAGRLHSCAVMTDGGVKCWGHGYFGELGDGVVPPPSGRIDAVDVSGLDARAVHVDVGSYHHSCALLEDGTVACWGDNAGGQTGPSSGASCAPKYEGCNIVPITVPLPQPATAVTLGSFFTCALLTSGDVSCWGNNYVGELGDGQACGTWTCGPVFVKNLHGNALAIASGSGHACAILAEGLKCWGDNSYGQIGDGNFTWNKNPYILPVSVILPPSGVEEIEGGWAFTCVRTEDGAGWCWGQNSTYQLAAETSEECLYGHRCSTTPIQALSEVKPTPTPSPTITPSPTPTRTPRPYLLGDPTCDGAINSVDAAVVLQFAGGLANAIVCPLNADVNGDSIVNAVDAALILQVTAGLLDRLAL